MKKILIIIFVLALVLAAAAALFMFTFDANRYRGALIAKLEESMGKDVMIDNISLGLWRGFGIEARGIAIKDKDKTWDMALLKAKNLSVNVKIPPLLKRDIVIQRLFVPELTVNPGASPSFRCSLDLNMNILINSLSREDMLETLTAAGTMKMEKAVLENMNVLKAALDKLSMLPDLVQKLKDNLPEKYGGLLSRNYTVFKPVNADFKIRDGKIFFDKLRVESDAFYLVSRGSIGMIDQSLQISSDFFIPKDLSGAFEGVAPELKYLADDDGLITMPLDIKGKIPD
ncbi:MAG: AsmA family protein, partial [Candidatus Omnitrophota bacterium]